MNSTCNGLEERINGNKNKDVETIINDLKNKYEINRNEYNKLVNLYLTVSNNDVLKEQITELNKNYKTNDEIIETLKNKYENDLDKCKELTEFYLKVPNNNDLKIKINNFQKEYLLK